MIAWFSTEEFSAENTGVALGSIFHWLLPGLSEAHIAALHAVIRKAAHLTEFAVLGGLWFVALTRERGLSRRGAAWVAWLVAVGWACLDELHQTIVPGRTPSVTDVLIDSTGALIAVLVGRYGSGRVLDAAALAFLWGAAAGGVLVIAIDIASGVSAGILWVTVPAAMLALALRRRLPLRR